MRRRARKPRSGVVPIGSWCRSSRPSASDWSHVSTSFTDLGVPADLVAVLNRAVDRRPVPDPGRHAARRPRRPRHLRSGADRLGQDHRLRAGAGHEDAVVAAPQAPGSRARADPRARGSGHPGGRGADPADGPRRARRLRRDGVPAPASSPPPRRRHRRRDAGPSGGPRRPARHQAGRRRHRRARRGRPHGGHGVPPRRSPHPRRRPGRTARPCCSPPRSTATSMS